MAVSRTMILLDPDLDADVSRQVTMPRRPAGSARGVLPRNQRIPSVRILAGFLREAQTALKLRGQVTVLLTTDTAIRRLNRQFRGKNKATDVLSFPAAPGPVKIAGDLAISIPTARRQAEERRHSLSIEIKVLVLHGLLHLAGYDHEIDRGEMDRLEQKIRARLRLPHGLIERTMSGRTKVGAPSLPRSYSGKGGRARTSGGVRS
jgi:probable rRNA maturation factor